MAPASSTPARATALALSILCTGVASSCGSVGGASDGSEDVAAEDAPVDPAPETDVPCTGLTGGACNVVEQCGCAGDDACQVLIDTETCEAVEQCLSLVESRDIGDECETSEQCRAGSSCLSMGSATRRCYEWCRATEDCTDAGVECFLSVNWTSPPGSPTCPGETITPPYLVCTLP